MEEKTREHIRKIVGEFHCPHDFRCVDEPDFCKVIDSVAFDHLKCVTLNIQDCHLSESSEEERLCSCPLRVYLSKRWRED